MTDRPAVTDGLPVSSLTRASMSQERETWQGRKAGGGHGVKLDDKGPGEGGGQGERSPRRRAGRRPVAQPRSAPPARRVQDMSATQPPKSLRDSLAGLHLVTWRDPGASGEKGASSGRERAAKCKERGASERMVEGKALRLAKRGVRGTWLRPKPRPPPMAQSPSVLPAAPHAP
jgi:hypothetical protein